METAAQMLGKIKSMKNASTSDVMKDPGKAMVAAASTGAVVGLFLGLRRRENVVLFVIAGAAVGAIAVKLFIRPKT